MITLNELIEIRDSIEFPCEVEVSRSHVHEGLEVRLRVDISDSEGAYFFTEIFSDKDIDHKYRKEHVGAFKRLARREFNDAITPSRELSRSIMKAYSNE